MGDGRGRQMVSRRLRVRLGSPDNHVLHGRSSRATAIDIEVDLSTNATIADVVDACTARIGVAAPLVAWRGSEVLDPMASAAVLSSGDVIDLLADDLTRVESSPMNLDGEHDLVLLDVVHGSGAGRSVVLGPTMFDLAMLCGPDSGAVAVRAGVVLWQQRGRCTELAFDVPLRVGAALVIVRRRPRSIDSSRMGTEIHRLPVFDRPVAVRVFGPLHPPDTARRAEARIPVAGTAVPLAGGVLGAMVFGRLEFLVISALAPLASLATYFTERRRARRELGAQRSKFVAELAAVHDAAHTTVQLAMRDAHDRDPDQAELRRRAEQRDGRLWDRDIVDGVRVRVGTGPAPAPVAFEVAGAPLTRETPDFDDLTAGPDVTALRRRFQTVHDHPIVVDLAGSLAIVGDDRVAVLDVVRAVMSQLACRYSPTQLRLVTDGLDSDGPELLSAWIPHRYFPTGAASTRGSGPTVVRFIDGDHINVPNVAVGPGGVAIAPPAAASAGPVVWWSTDSRRTPRWCETVLTVDGANSLVRTRVGDIALEPDRLDAEGADALGRRLAPLREAGQDTVDHAADLPGTLGLSSRLDVDSVVAEVLQRWSQSASDSGLVVAIGVDGTGPVTFDLVTDGPHALVAGTTGSGKSVLLQTVLLSLAARYRPSRVQFLGIDFKGGSTFHSLAQLAHCAGVVTNLDGVLAERVLVSLRSELARRMRLLEGRASDVPGLRALDPAGAPPSLVVVIDEFATLVREAPGFVDAMVDLAQRGRSLGLHLVLATQRPTGAVNDAILANTSIRIALRTADASESSSIIDDPSAADLVGPGHALVRIGSNPLRRARVPALMAAISERQPVVLRDLLDRERSPSQAAGDAREPNQRDLLVDALERAAHGEHRPDRPWLDPLADVMGREDLVALLSERGMAVPHHLVGLIDVPECQAQVPLVAPRTGSVLVCGAPGSGRSSALAGVLTAAATSPDRVRIHVVDWTGRSPLTTRVGLSSVVRARELEPLTRLMQHLERKGAQYRSAESSDSVIDVVAIEGGVQLIEDLAAVEHGYWVSTLTKLARDAAGDDVLLIWSAARQRELPSSLCSAMTAVWLLRPGHRDDFVFAGVPGAVIAAAESAPPGRVLVGNHWAQLLWPSPSPSASREVGDRLFELPQMWELDRDLSGDQGVTIGLADLSGDQVVWTATGHVAIVGPDASGSTNALAVFAIQWPEPVTRVIVAAETNRLVGLGCWDLRIDPECPPGWSSTLPNGPLLVAVDAAEAIGAGLAVDLDAVAGDRRVSIVVACTPNRFERAFSGWLAEVKRTGRALVLAPERAADVELLTGRRIRLRPDQSFPPGRGVWVDRRSTTLVQVALIR